MAKITKHRRIEELKLRVRPISYSGLRHIRQDTGDAEGPIDFKVISDEGKRTVKGYLCVWGIEDTYGTIFLKGCFNKSIAERGPASTSKQKIAFLWMHDQTDPLGQYTKLVEDDYGLYFEANIDEVEGSPERALRQITSGTLNQFSVGFDYLWDKVEYDEDLDAVVIKECILMEGSVVTFGSNPETYAMRSAEQLIKDKENLIEETNEFVRSLPLSKRLEVRQLIAKHISLALTQPVKPTEPLEQEEPTFSERAMNWGK